MSDERKEIICPNCGATIATAPTDRDLETPLICSHCGTAVHGPGPAEKAVETVKETLEETVDKVEEQLSRRKRD